MLFNDRNLPIIKELPKNEKRLALMLKALGNPIRFQIMRTIAERQTCITGEIVATTSLAQSTVSQHLKVLRDAGLIVGEIEGPATCYCINPVAIAWMKEQIEGWLPECCSPKKKTNPENRAPCC
jgi:ArsR family transcriptional regulator